MPANYIRKTTRPYARISAATISEVECWWHARRQLGNQKEKAAALGISIERMQAICKQVRARHPKRVAWCVRVDRACD